MKVKAEAVEIRAKVARKVLDMARKRVREM